MPSNCKSQLDTRCIANGISNTQKRILLGGNPDAARQAIELDNEQRGLCCSFYVSTTEHHA
jgi:hypothetical protein